MEQVVVFGGTFNPIHMGHLRIAEEVRQLFRLREVIFMPSAIPPHKPAQVIVSPKHRLAMTILATTDNLHFSTSAIEVDRNDRSFTIDTLRELKGCCYQTEFYFMVGLDAFLEIHSWKEAANLFNLCKFVVVHRPGVSQRDFLAYINSEFFKQIGGLKYQILDQTSSIDYNSQVFLLDIPSLDISSSSIRRMVRQGKSIKYLAPAAVENYIRKQSLYR